MEDRIKIFKVMFIAGLFIMALAIFVDSFKVASLSGLKSGEKRLKIELKEKYNVEAPEKPIDESRYVLAPDAPAKDASQEEKDSYESEMGKFRDTVDSLKKKYKQDLESYASEYKEYQRASREMDMLKSRDMRENRRLSEELDKDIELSQLSVNEFMFSTFLRFLGCLVLLAGSLGILLFGDNYERLGVLFVIGFSLKTIIGL